MNQNMNRRTAVKALAAISGLLLTNPSAWAGIQKKNPLAKGWLFQGQPCVIEPAGAMLLLINENSAVGTAVFTGENSLVVLAGSGWDAGLTAQILNRGRTINWANGTVWNKGPAPRPIADIAGGWLFQDQPCAIFQHDSMLLFINENGALGTGLWATNNRLVITGGNGWDLGLVGQLANDGNSIQWVNNTVWLKN